MAKTVKRTAKKNGMGGGWGALSPWELRSISMEALIDPRTLRRALSGGQVRVLGLERIRRALAVRKLSYLLPEERARP